MIGPAAYFAMNIIIVKVKNILLVVELCFVNV